MLRRKAHPGIKQKAYVWPLALCGMNQPENEIITKKKKKEAVSMVVQVEKRAHDLRHIFWLQG